MNSLYALNSISRQGHFDALRRASRIAAKEPCYLGLIAEVRDMHPGMGLRKMYEQFEPEGIGRDAFIALGLREGYRLQSGPDKPYRTTNSIKSARFANLLVGKWFTTVNQVWVSDLFYFPLPTGRHGYVVLIMDVYSRRIVGYSVAANMRAEHNIRALQMALALRGITSYGGGLIHHSDRGSQYVSDDYTHLLQDYGIGISMCREVLENAHCERANGIIKNEYLNRWGIDSFEQLEKRTAQAVANYNNRRHNNLGMTPNQYEAMLPSIEAEKRTRMKFFTIDQSQIDPAQLSLFTL